MLEKISIGDAINGSGELSGTRRSLAPTLSRNSQTELSHHQHRAFRALFSTPSLLTLVFILAFTQLYAILPRTAGFTGARLVFVVIVTLNKPRTSGRR